MCDGQTNVFIKMKRLNLRPIDVLGFSERAQEFELRCSRSRDNASLSSLRYSAPNRRRSLISGSTAQRSSVPEYFEQHGKIQCEMEIGNELYKPTPLADAAVN
jgi:hypothetical protein